MKLVQTTLRSIIGDMGLDDTLVCLQLVDFATSAHNSHNIFACFVSKASREEIQQLLLFKIKKTCQNWG